MEIRNPEIKNMTKELKAIIVEDEEASRITPQQLLNKVL